MRPLTLCLAALTACTVNGLPSTAWDADAIVASPASLLVPFRDGRLVTIEPAGTFALVDQGPWRVEWVDAPPSGVVVALRRFAVRCEDHDGPRTPTTPDDCDGDLVRETSVRLLRDGAEPVDLDVDPVFGRLSFSTDGRWAVARPDPNRASESTEGFISLDTLWVVDTEGGTSFRVPVGFDTSSVRFVEDGDGAAQGLVALSPNEVGFVSLSGTAPEVTTTYPLTLDNDDQVTPLSVAFTADRSHALVTVAGIADLYTLDLVNPSINLVALRRAPSAVYVDVVRDRSLILYENEPWLDVVDHDLFTVTSVRLGEGATAITTAGDIALLTNRLGRDAVRVDLETLDTVEYSLKDSPLDVWLSPDAAFGLLTVGTSVSPRVQVIDLREIDGRVDDDVRVVGTRGRITDVAWSDPADGLTARILQEGVDQLYTFDPQVLGATEIELAREASRLGRLADGTAWIAHPDALGLISFVDADGAVTEVSDFAAHGMLDESTLLTDEGEE